MVADVSSMECIITTSLSNLYDYWWCIISTVPSEEFFAALPDD